MILLMIKEQVCINNDEQTKIVVYLTYIKSLKRLMNELM